MSSTAAIHVAKKQLGLDDDTYRAVLVQVTGKPTTRDMTEPERQRVIEHLRKRGFTKGSNNRRRPLEGQYAKKLQALWIAAWNLGITRNRDDAALIAFVRRQTGIDHVRFVQYPGDAAKAIEALKGWMAREGGVDWSAPGKYTPDWRHRDGYKIAAAQWRLIWKGEEPHHVGVEAQTLCGKSIHEIDNRDWQAVMNDLGRRIREGEPR